MSHEVKPRWKRARDAVTLTVFATLWVSAAGCIGVRNQLFQPLPHPSGTDTILDFERTPRPRSEKENHERETIPPPPDTEWKMEPHEDGNDLLLELEDIEPTPEPLGRGRDRGTTPGFLWRGRA